MPISPAVLELADNAAASANAVMQKGTKKNVLEQLNGYKFTDVNGNDVTISNYAKDIKNHYTSFSAGFKDCDEACRYADPGRAKAKEKYASKDRGFVTFVIDVDPVDQSGSLQRRKDYQSELEQTIGGKVVILFPKDISQSYEIQAKLGLIANPDKNKTKQHSDSIRICAPGGDFEELFITHGTVTPRAKRSR